MSTQSITVSHNAEVAHRLSQLAGQCENIHGHSLWLTLTLTGQVDDNGVLDSRDFGAVKQAFRSHIDTAYDHRLLLWSEDPLAQQALANPGAPYPGLQLCPGDPTTENIAAWLGRWAVQSLAALLT